MILHEMLSPWLSSVSEGSGGGVPSAVITVFAGMRRDSLMRRKRKCTAGGSRSLTDMFVAR